MNKIKNASLNFVIAAIIFFPNFTLPAQQLRLSLNLSPQPNPYLSTWSTHRETVILTIANATNSSVQAKLYARILVDGRLKAETKSMEMPMINIPPGVSVYYGDELIPFQSVKLYDDVEATARKTGMLPAGQYEFCVELLDAGNVRITEPACRQFFATSYQTPVLLQPENEKMLKKNERTTFRWSPVVPAPRGPVMYRVQIFEVLLGQYPMQAFRSNQPIIDVDVMNRMQLLWPPDFILPDSTSQYIWSVQALDSDGNPIGEPEGRAEPFTFKIQ